MRTEKSQLATKTTALNEVKGLLSSLKSSISGLSSTEAFQKKSATFTNSSTEWKATASKDTPSGTYKINFSQFATPSKLTGGGSIATPIAVLDPISGQPVLISSLPVGRTITGDYFTINGERIPIQTTETLSQVISNINASSAGVTANLVGEKLEISSDDGLSPVVLGSSNDTSNFLQAMRISSSIGATAISSSDLSSPLLSIKIDQAHLASPPTSGPGTFKINGETISYDTTTDTLQDVLNKISDSGAGVTATFNLSTGRFQLFNKETGNVGIAVTEDIGGLAAAMGLTTATLTSGDDAEFSINGGGTLTSRSNILDDSAHGITGLSVTANSIREETITIGADSTSIKEALNNFIEKYNAVQNAIEKYTKVTVDGSKVSSAVLAGNRELATISRELRRILYTTGQDSTGADLTGNVKRLSDLGIGFSGIENTISLTNSSLFNSRLVSASADIINYFTTENKGLVDRLDATLNRYVSDSSTAPGTFKVSIDSISSQNKSLDKQIAEFERRLDSQRSFLESSFIAMERAQSSFQQQSSYLAKTFSGNSK
jgi:flagellar hook-associated protein 2